MQSRAITSISFWVAFLAGTLVAAVIISAAFRILVDFQSVPPAMEVVMAAGIWFFAAVAGWAYAKWITRRPAAVRTRSVVARSPEQAKDTQR